MRARTTTPMPDLVAVPAGTAWIGSTASEVDAAVDAWAGRLIDDRYGADDLRRWLDKEIDLHPRAVGAFLLGRHQVSVAEAARFAVDTGWALPASAVTGDPLLPAWGLSACDAAAYCDWLGRRIRRRVRLPTEAEWEWAARGPERLEYPWGAHFDPARCVTHETSARPRPIGDRPSGASPCGAEDMAGNVAEWTSTWYHPYPGGRRVVDDIYVVNGGPYLVMRGGSCGLGGDAARGARRHGPNHGAPYRFRGLRIAVDGT